MSKSAHLLELPVIQWMHSEHITQIDEVRDSTLEDMKTKGFKYILLSGSWAVGKQGKASAMLRHRTGEFKRTLPDVTAADILGTRLAPLTPLQLDSYIGSIRSLSTFRSRLSPTNLLLDFVANHTARDASWTVEHPEYYIYDKKLNIALATSDKFRWEDTAQINIWCDKVRKVLIDQVLFVAGICDGIRCNMADLCLNEHITKTWRSFMINHKFKRPETEFWTDCIKKVKESYPSCIFIAETSPQCTFSQQEFLALGFDYVYKQEWPSLLESGHLDNIRHFISSQSSKSLQSSVFKTCCNQSISNVLNFGSQERACCASALTYILPGLHVHKMGQHEGAENECDIRLRRQSKIETNIQTKQFFDILQSILKSKVFSNGRWEYLPVNGEESSWRLIACRWRHRQEKRLCVVNFSDSPGNGLIVLSNAEPDGNQETIPIFELISNQTYLRQVSTLRNTGLRVQVNAYTIQIFKY